VCVLPLDDGERRRSEMRANKERNKKKFLSQKADVKREEEEA